MARNTITPALAGRSGSVAGLFAAVSPWVETPGGICLTCPRRSLDDLLPSCHRTAEMPIRSSVSQKHARGDRSLRTEIPRREALRAASTLARSLNMLCDAS